MGTGTTLEIVNLSDTGRKRPHNEDSCVTDAGLGLAVLADGMGGYKAGEVASAIAVMQILVDVRDGLKKIRGGRDSHNVGPDGLTPTAHLVQQAVMAANRAVHHTAETEPQCQGMGTTVVSTLFHGDKVTIAHVGDSRLYRMRGDSFQQLTSDHSLIQELIDRGFYTPEEAAQNTPKNLVTRALGIEPDVQVDVREDTIQAGDIYLLCSDGLNDMVTDEEIRLTLGKYSANLASAGAELIRLANANGGKDNISVILVRPRTPVTTKRHWYEKFTDWFN
ncbi:MAG: Stp1/IreP family PP2C-type Ser/Thr phosphatase [Gammaproteobacteria bacterium]